MPQIKMDNPSRSTKATAPTTEETSVLGVLAGMYAAIELLKMRDQVLNGTKKHSALDCTVCRDKAR